MKLLLDTHVLLWAIHAPKLLSARVRKALLDEANQLFASVVSLWEIRLKVDAGKLILPPGEGFLQDNFRTLGVQSYISMDVVHVHHLSQLPPIHKGPFDRLLIAQSIVEGCTFISKDRDVAKYPAKVLW